DRDRETRTRGSGLKSYFTFVVSDDRLADRESHAGAFSRFFGREEGVEDPRPILERNSRSRILEADFGGTSNGAFALDRCPHFQSSTLRCHRIEGIHNQIDEHLL